MSRAEHYIYERGLVVRNDPKTGRVQVCIPKALRERAMKLAHYPKLASHPGATRMYQTMRHDLFWPKKSYDVHDFVLNCNSCARKRISSQRKTTHLKLFLPSSALEFISMDILGPLPETREGNRFLLVIVDRFSKLTRTVPLKQIVAEEVSKCMEHQLFS
jgi:hypothetical protein